MSVYVDSGDTFVVAAGGVVVPGEYSQIVRYRVEERGLESKRVLVDHRSFRFDNFVDTVRISPDQRYIAYTVEVMHRLPIPFPAGAMELWVYDVDERSRRRIGQLQHAANIMWSPDSKRVYIAGRDRYSAPIRLWVYEREQR